MSSCCRCTGSGRCSNCRCRKARRHCSDCLPNRMNQCENQPESSRSSSGEPALIHPADDTAMSRRDADQTPLSVGSCETVDPVEPPVPDLPQLGQPNFRWGNLDGNSFSRAIDKAYEETVHWKCNLFDVPRGNAGTLFVQETARLLDAYSHATVLEGIALKAVMVLPPKSEKQGSLCAIE